jgi:hypothetical protein
MKKISVCSIVLSLLLLGACNTKPSDKDIKNKILLDYICAETATVNDLKILNTRDAVAIFGNKGLEYQVSGEVTWEKGCREFGSMLFPGHKERFENKTVFLIKDNEGNWR